MARRFGTRTRKPKGPKRVSYELIDKNSVTGGPMYKLLRDLVHEHHREVAEARIALAWCTSWRKDVDGRLPLGRCRKGSDLDRELAPFDFVVVLNKPFWTDPSTTEKALRAVLDHELCHCSVRLDKHDEPEQDAKGRIVYRIRKHDLEEFSEIAERYGCWKRDIEAFHQALRRSKQLELPVDEKKPDARKPSGKPDVAAGSLAVQ